MNIRPLAKIKNLPLGEESGFGRETSEWDFDGSDSDAIQT